MTKVLFFILALAAAAIAADVDSGTKTMRRRRILNMRDNTGVRLMSTHSISEISDSQTQKESSALQMNDHPQLMEDNETKWRADSTIDDDAAEMGYTTVVVVSGQIDDDANEMGNIFGVIVGHIFVVLVLIYICRRCTQLCYYVTKDIRGAQDDLRVNISGNKPNERVEIV